MTVLGHLYVRLTDQRVLHIRGERGTEITYFCHFHGDVVQW